MNSSTVAYTGQVTFYNVPQQHRHVYQWSGYFFFLCCAYLSLRMRFLNWETLFFIISDCVNHRSFITSWGMKNSGIWKSWCAPISLKLLCCCLRTRKYFLRQSNTVLWFVLSSHMTNLIRIQYCPEPEYTFYVAARLYSYLFSSHMISLTSNESSVLL